MRDLGQRQLNLGAEDAADKLKPVTDAGSGAVQDKQKKRLEEIIAALSGLFGDGLTEGDLVSFQEAVERKMMESDVLRNQAAANTKEQFVHSPALPDELMNAIMDTMAVHQSMSRQALNSDAIRAAMLATMLAQGGLWEAFRQRTDAAGHM